MNLNNLSKKMQTLYGAPSGAELIGLKQALTPKSATLAPATTTTTKTGLRFDVQAAQSAQAQMKLVDPALAAKMDAFHQQFDKMRKDGATEGSVRSAVKDLFASLSEGQKTQVNFSSTKA